MTSSRPLPLSDSIRCKSMFEEYGTADAQEHVRRSWRCSLPLQHTGKHRSYADAGHRAWTDEEVDGRAT